MKYLIASDIHGSAYWTERLVAAIESEQPDRIVLLGDLLYHGPRNDLPRDYAPKRVIPLLNALADRIIAVRGNCDAEVDQMVLDFPVMADYATANKQNKFWEFHDSLYTHKGYIDSIAAFNIAQNMSMDINKFQNDITNNEGKKSIEKTINQLVLLGIYATPTIIINGRLIVNSNSKEEICHLIDEELLK